jgi:hypothetical protein
MVSFLLVISLDWIVYKQILEENEEQQKETIF